MITQTIINPIGKGQYTFPASWRKFLGIDKKSARARLEENKIIIEAIEEEKTELNWEIGLIDMAVLNDETIDAIKQSHQNYVKKNTSAFLSEDQFWSGVFKK